jgi:hypothetical protein
MVSDVLFFRRIEELWFSYPEWIAKTQNAVIGFKPFGPEFTIR